MTALWLSALLMAWQVAPGEQPVGPYAQSDANAGAVPFKGQGMWRAFHEQAGVDRIVDRMLDRIIVDKRIAEILQGQDIIRLRRTLKEQFCYLLGGDCSYTGRDMAAGHKNLGIQTKDFNALNEDLQIAMAQERVRIGAESLPRQARADEAQARADEAQGCGAVKKLRRIVGARKSAAQQLTFCALAHVSIRGHSKAPPANLAANSAADF